ncbi:ATP-dependent metallopeptidase FtsH/Yme1/Tma family protein [Chamaesiphon sp. VAR_48_metabat_403]|uniref:ATP-dependent metallopeptidase FtsH/Yme1/Tma family protein n=1 Tax=Chamaesiphon sp. VAR_48_metabat_403 TaxID=2964700 RepID=UPI00286D9DC6|nr:ATP-dependent metallopeptidase FtsH/Yme1/Tma family protein [Chamaesiphon sp. VAR_48_metabat_403]
MRDNQWKKSRQPILLFLIASLTIISSACANYLGGFADSSQFSQAKKTLKYSDFIQQVEQGKIKKVGLSTDRTKILLKDTDGVKAIVNIPPNSEELIDTLTKKSVEIYVISK